MWSKNKMKTHENNIRDYLTNYTSEQDETAFKNEISVLVTHSTAWNAKTEDRLGESRWSKLGNSPLLLLMFESALNQTPIVWKI